MIAFLAALLAATAAMAAVVAIGWRPDRLLIARVGIGAETAHPRGHRLAAAGAWPLVRRIRVSDRTSGRLALSGISMSERDLAAVKGLGTAAVVVGCSVVVPLLALPAGLLAFRLPDVAVARIARKRLAKADREVPVLVDLLAIATSSGLPPQLAFRRAVGAAEGPLADELRSVLNVTDLGGRWRDELRAASGRLDLPDLHRVVAALTRSESLGSSLGEELPRLANDVREVRSASATERARAAPVKMLFPLVFLILPAFLLLTVVPVLVTTVRSIG
ncbi:MAG: type II secretion system F family protein [Actinobacteria bacterium]|nr:type II secretion system F family protein [Actinomycetota bacterium]